MAFAGLKKQINKANQFMNEKIGGVEGTKLNDDFVEMERKTDIMCELVEDLQLKTKEFLHPNPASRAKMSAVKGISKLSGQAKAATYPQPEGVLGESMSGFGKKIGEDSLYAQSLIESGESLKQIADNKYNLDDNMKMNFIEPLHNLSSKDIKEVMHHRKKLQGRRLDYDCKRRRKDKGGRSSPATSVPGTPTRSRKVLEGSSNIADEDIKNAEEKFAESLNLAQITMNYLLDNDVEGISQLATFAENLLEYHKACGDILENLVGTLHDKKNEAANAPKREFVPKTLQDLGIDISSSNTLNGGITPNITASITPQRSPYGSPQRSPAQTPTQAASPLPSPMKTEQPSWEPLSFKGQGGRSPNASPLPSPMRSPARTPMGQQPCAQALYDFEPENPTELGFNEGDTIILNQRIDENWYEGTVRGKTGLFPVSYVDVTVPIP